MEREYRRLTMGSTHQTIYMPDIGRFSTSIPPTVEQDSIVAFLREHTRGIDALVAKKQRLLELLQEKRTALITRTVTKGLDPNAPMKDSGVEWLGEIPAQWEAKRVRQSCSRVTDGAHISPDTSSADFPFVSTIDIRGGTIDFDGCLRTSASSYAYMERTGCRPMQGDVLFSKDGTVGTTAVVATDREFAVASSLVIISPDHRELNSRWLDYWLNGAFIKDEVELLLSGAALRRISVAKVARLPLLLPPRLDEQSTIAALLDRETAKLDTLAAKVREAIERLQEFRSALISAAVTGKIDVREQSGA
jgi:type I restriction enzyme S subunit